MLEIPAPHGTLRLPIVGIVLDYSDQQGTLLMDRRLFQRYWHDDSVNVFRVYVTAGAEVPDVKRRILERYGGQQQVFVLTNRELKAYILKVTDQWFGLTNVQIAVAVLVAILGIVNALTVSITDRRRELGVLQAVGGLRNQIRHTIWLEAIASARSACCSDLAWAPCSCFTSCRSSTGTSPGCGSTTPSRCRWRCSSCR